MGCLLKFNSRVRADHRGQGGVSECRNKSLQLMFQFMGGADKAGSGMDKTAVQAVVTAQVEGSVTNGRMQEITGEHSKDITAVLQSLVRAGLLTQQNQRRWASYRVAGDSPQVGEDSRHLEGDSRHLEGDSPHLPPELLSLAESARRKAKLPMAEMQTLVLKLCDTRWLTTRDLAEVLRRDPENLQRRILTGLVRQGLLELRYPSVPNRPDQAYRSVVKSGP